MTQQTPVAAQPAAHAAGLAHVPITVFASVMGVAGLGLAWRKAAPLLGLPAAIGEAMLVLAGILFVAALVTYALKLVRHPAACKGEFNHPIRSSFFAAFSIGLLLLATGAHPHAPKAAEAMWVIGALAQFGITVRVFARWIVHKQELAHANPAWFIPIVGNIIVPILGVRLGQADVSWFFFSVGMALWLPMLAIILNRVIFHDDLPPRLVPTLFILVPPPAIGYLAYTTLVGGADAFANVLVNLALFITMVLLVMGPRFARLPFAVSWWAFTFPLDAAALAALEHGHRNPGNWLFAIAAPVLLGLATMVVALVLARTAAGTVKGTLFVPE
ncbi:MAG TPA: SLAC1 anion channel family protein [Candidatus Omnitrophota bacterium]|nr:SLAC1 anion channel family protein [Candidatus Omnitrophota bacterium]